MPDIIPCNNVYITIGTSCGIPDFRSRDGLYSQLQRCGLYDLDDPQQMYVSNTLFSKKKNELVDTNLILYLRFDMNYFEENPHGKRPFGVNINFQ